MYEIHLSVNAGSVADGGGNQLEEDPYTVLDSYTGYPWDRVMPGWTKRNSKVPIEFCQSRRNLNEFLSRLASYKGGIDVREFISGHLIFADVPEQPLVESLEKMRIQ